MKMVLAAFACGVLFAAGLGLSGMTDPARVVGFLNVRGPWDPTLAFVMAGALAVHAVGHRLITRRRAPLVATRFVLPQASGVDARLIVGSLVFGVGWGLSGYCPGPALASLAGAAPGVLVFVGAMAAGMGLHALVDRPAVSAQSAEAPSETCG